MNGVTRRFPPVSLALATAFVLAHVAFTFSAPILKAWLLDNFAVVPFRFAPNTPEPFTHWYEALGPLIGHAFLHLGWLHLAMNTFVFLQAAPFVETRLGAWRMLALFAISAASAAIAYILINSASTMGAIGASGAVCGVFAAYFLSVRANWRDAFADPQIRNAALFFLIVNVGLALIINMTGVLPFGIAWEAHLGGFIGGALAYPLLAPPPRHAGPWG